jgi:hypothetical protein
MVEHELTSAEFAKLGIASVGMGGCVYTMKSACATWMLAAAARARRLDLNIILTLLGVTQ